MKLASKLSAATLVLALSTSIALAQTSQPTPKPAADTNSARPNADTFPEQTFYLKNADSQTTANEIVTSLRNALPPNDKIYLVFNQNALLVRAPSDDLALIQKLLNDLDRPRKTYRLTYTISEMDGSKLVGTQHYAMVLAAGQETVLKQGNKIPVATGSYDSGTSGAKAGVSGVQTQFTYIDVGMNVDATLTAMGDGAMLKFDVVQSSIAPEKSTIEGVTEPIIRQTELKGESLLAPGKPLMLGSVDNPGSAGHLDIEVVMDPLP